MSPLVMVNTDRHHLETNLRACLRGSFQVGQREVAKGTSILGRVVISVPSRTVSHTGRTRTLTAPQGTLASLPPRCSCFDEAGLTPGAHQQLCLRAALSLSTKQCTGLCGFFSLWLRSFLPVLSFPCFPSGSLFPSQRKRTLRIFFVPCGRLISKPGKNTGSMNVKADTQRQDATDRH